MKKCIIVFTVILFLTVSFAFADDLVDLGSSNQSASTIGYEQNQYDWLINPADFGKITDSTLFFSLDASANQFGEDVVGDGFRGGYAWIRDGFSPLIALNYRTTSYTSTEEAGDNTVLDYGNYDSVTGLYATIDETVNISSTARPMHWLMSHIGGEIAGVGNVDIQTSWYMFRETGETTFYTDQYTNTAAVSAASLTTKGNLTETTYDLIGYADNLLAIEPEISLNIGDISTTIALGIGLYNLGASDDSWIRDVTIYSIGADATLLDRITTTSDTGSFYYAGGSFRLFDMTAAKPVYVERSLINVDSVSTINLKDDLELEVPLYFGITLYPDLATTDITDTVNYTDLTSLELNRTVDTITTDLTVDSDINMGIGGTVKKTFAPSENSALYIGAGMDFDMQMYSDSRSRTDSTHIQIDADADGLYTTAGVDTDILYTLSGWEIETTRNDYTISLGIPIAVSYSPVKSLTFHAGTTTTMEIQFIDSTSLITQDAGIDYSFETFTDNLEPVNSYTIQQIDTSDPSSTPSASFDTDFNFTATGAFGFTLEISDNFTIDALALASSMAIQSFSLSGIFVLP